MKEYKLTKCPCCRRRLTYLEGLVIKSKDEYECPHCKNKLQIKYTDDIKKKMIITVIASFIIFLIAMFINTEKSLLWFFLIFVPFIVFYLYIPFKIDLIKKDDL